MPLPDLFVIGAPKAGSTAVHAALASHADIHMSVPKEPKYFLCGDAPPPPFRGPGDAHSRKEWVWRRDEYERLFADAPEGTRLGESTPFYLWSTEAQARLAEAVPEARLIAIVRDPVDRAYSNWSHLRGHGYEPVGDFVAAVEQEPRRVADGWAPFWHYVALGRYGEQLQHLYEHFPREQVLVLRYRDLVDEPASTLAAIATFVDVDPDGFGTVPAENVQGWAGDSAFDQALRALVRGGAWLGQAAPAPVWRAAERPLRALLQRGGAHRPALRPEERAAVQRHFVDDIGLLGQLTGRDFADWLGQEGRGAYSLRRS